MNIEQKLPKYVKLEDGQYIYERFSKAENRNISIFLGNTYGELLESMKEMEMLFDGKLPDEIEHHIETGEIE